MSAFWTLVNNTQKIRKERSHRQTGWFKVYLLIAALLALSGYLTGVYRGVIFPQFPLIFVFWLLIFSFSISISAIKQEWQGDTVGWWLSLPYSRTYLLGAKILGIFLRYLKFVGIAIIITLALVLTGKLINPSIWTGDALSDLFANGLRLYGLLMLFTPMIITFSVTLGILIKSNWRPLTPLFWVFLPVAMTALVHLGQQTMGLAMNNQTNTKVLGFHFLNQARYVPLEILLVVVISFLFFEFSAYLLNRQVEL